MAEIRSSPKAHTITWPFSAKTAEDLDYNFDILMELLGTVIRKLNDLGGIVDEIPDPAPPPTMVSLGSMSMGGEDGEDGMPGPPGPAGPRGPAGPCCSMPLWSMDEPEVYPEIVPLLSLRNPNQIPEEAIMDGTIYARVAAAETISNSWSFTGFRQEIATASSPQLQFRETGAAADNRIWRLAVASSSFVLQPMTDAGSVDNAIVLSRSGQTTTSMLLYTAYVQMGGALNPQFVYYDPTQTTDTKYWRTLMISGQFFIQTVNDAFNTGANAYSIIRSGNSVTEHHFYTNATDRLSVDTNGLVRIPYAMSLAGRSAVTVGADQTAWSPTGLGVVFVIYAEPTGVTRTIHGITAQADGYVFVLRNTATTIAFTIASESASASAANRIEAAPGGGFSIAAGNSAMFIYDGTTSRWRVISFRL